MSLTNLSRSSEEDWLRTRIAETVMAGLSNVTGLTVVSRARVVEILRKLGGPEGNEDALAARLGLPRSQKYRRQVEEPAHRLLASSKNSVCYPLRRSLYPE